MPDRDSLTQYAVDQSKLADLLGEGKERFLRERDRSDADPVTRLFQVQEDLAGAIRSRSYTRRRSCALDLIALGLRVMDGVEPPLDDQAASA